MRSQPAPRISRDSSRSRVKLPFSLRDSFRESHSSHQELLKIGEEVLMEDYEDQPVPWPSDKTMTLSDMSTIRNVRAFKDPLKRMVGTLEILLENVQERSHNLLTSCTRYPRVVGPCLLMKGILEFAI